MSDILTFIGESNFTQRLKNIFFVSQELSHKFDNLNIYWLEISGFYKNNQQFLQDKLFLETKDIEKIVNIIDKSKGSKIVQKGFIYQLKDNNWLVFYERDKYKSMISKVNMVIEQKSEIAIKFYFEDKNDYKIYYLWALEQYKFDFFKKWQTKVKIVLSPFEFERLKEKLYAVFLLRDLINFPANILTPDVFEEILKELVSKHIKNNDVKIYVHKPCDNIQKDKDNFKRDFPLIHAVGKAALCLPRLVECIFSPKVEKEEKLSIIGKGVCFDTGGVNIKTGASIGLMKKDMGGAAHSLAVFLQLINDNYQGKIQLLLPIVENSVASNAMRPSDVIRARNGLAVEIGNTDAEGRLILADAIDYAKEFKAKYLLTLATLTGAARVALGPDIVPFYTNNVSLSGKLMQSSKKQEDPLWNMPLYAHYKKYLNSQIADLNNIAANSFAGSIMAALFLQEFVAPEQRDNWLHLDLYGWTNETRPCHPKGGTDNGFLAVCDFLKSV